MTYQSDGTLPVEWIEQIAAKGTEAFPELTRILINKAMRLEREQYTGAIFFGRSPERSGHANGNKPETINTRVGKIQFEVSQVRQGALYPEALEKGLRSERALTPSLAEIVVQRSIHQASSCHHRKALWYSCEQYAGEQSSREAG